MRFELCTCNCLGFWNQVAWDFCEGCWFRADSIVGDVARILGKGQLYVCDAGLRMTYERQNVPLEHLFDETRYALLARAEAIPVKRQGPCSPLKMLPNDGDQYLDELFDGDLPEEMVGLCSLISFP